MISEQITRNFGPIYDKSSRIVILGSFPSVKSREKQFYYGHPQNRFWPLLFDLLNVEPIESNEGKRNLVLSNHIALWDVVESCSIVGSSDSSINNVVPVDITKILTLANIVNIYCNGATSYNLFIKYLFPICNIEPIKLPSTSPANAAWSLQKLKGEWTTILKDIK